MNSFLFFALLYKRDVIKIIIYPLNSIFLGTIQIKVIADLYIDTTLICFLSHLCRPAAYLITNDDIQLSSFFFKLQPPPLSLVYKPTLTCISCCLETFFSQEVTSLNIPLLASIRISSRHTVREWKPKTSESVMFDIRWW